LGIIAVAGVERDGGDREAEQGDGQTDTQRAHAAPLRRPPMTGVHVRPLVAVPAHGHRQALMEITADLRLRKHELDLHRPARRSALELGDAQVDARLERAVAGPQMDRRGLEHVDGPVEIEPDHVHVVSAARHFSRLADVGHEEVSRPSEVRPGTPARYPRRTVAARTVRLSRRRP
jgi:hypothetical protein